MKKISILLITLISSVAMANFGEDLPTQVDVKPNRVYIPKGFDSNDQVQVVVEGYFPNGCYRPGQAVARVDQEANEIFVSTKAYLYSGICIQVIVNYSKVVDIGLLKEGTYKIYNETDKSLLSEITIESAKVSDPDDFNYAPVNQALLTKTNNETVLVLTGTFTNSCLSLDEVKASVYKDSVVVQPIVKISNKNCKEGSFPYKYNGVVEDMKNPGRYLLHVRSINGKSFNNLVDIN